MSDFIKETYTLPSLGKFYGEGFNPEVTLRSMTLEDELMRLNSSPRPYQPMCNVIDACLVGPNKPKISSYDMCISDYQFLLHTLRIVTYGNQYKLESVCPYCNESTITTVNMGDIDCHYYKDEYEKYLKLELPVTKKLVTIKLQTPRDLDNITIRLREMRKDHPESTSNPMLLLTLKTFIKTVDGEVLDSAIMDVFLRKLPMQDVNYILKCAEKLTDKIGLDSKVMVTCPNPTCGVDYIASFRINAEFFGPSIDD